MCILCDNTPNCDTLCSDEKQNKLNYKSDFSQYMSSIMATAMNFLNPTIENTTDEDIYIITDHQEHERESDYDSDEKY